MQAKITEYVNTTQRTEGEDFFQETEVGFIPEDWEVTKLGDLIYNREKLCHQRAGWEFLLSLSFAQ